MTLYTVHEYMYHACNTGSVEDVGIGDGKHYSVNVPLQEGMDDESYRFMFEPIMQRVSASLQTRWCIHPLHQFLRPIERVL